MDILNEFEQAQYEVLCALDEKEDHRTFLLRSQAGVLFVRKEVPEWAFETSKHRHSITNAHLIPLDHAYRSDGRFFLVEPYISGTSLNTFLAEKGTLGEKEAVELILQVLDGLAALHAVGIIHRDITPQNILISSDGVIKLLDFGIARTQSPNKSQDTEILGTQGYAAPEQFGFRQTDSRADIYSAGVLLNVMLTGHFPNEIVCENKKIAAIIAKATSLDPSARFVSAKEMHRAIYHQIIEPRNDPWQFPGFRSSALYKRTIAGVIYAACGFCLLVYCSDALLHIRYYALREIVSAVMVFVFVPLLYGNYLYWDSRFFLGYLPKPLRIIIRIIIATAILYVGMEMYVGVSTKFPTG